ncbi:helix-turn-helix domain-containing protein [Sphingomonas arantia]|uniref:Helix-turn-helix domain-containing protein n=1 Tax=Sphingomonas arantia TaxID=1460676 RepID=A0ABW4U0I2_9SPHN
MLEPTRAVVLANAAFPHLEIDVQDDRPDRMITARRVGRYPIARFQAPATVVETVGQRSVAAGLGKYLKLLWQLDGTTRYEDASGALDIKPGNLILTPMNGDYRMDMREGHDALLIAFDPADEPRWSALASDVIGTRIKGGDGTNAAAGGINALLTRGQGDHTAELAARVMIDLALASTRETATQEPPLLARAALSIVRNIADASYGPTDLASDVGMSRRSLYARLGALGTTPGALIRRIRLDRARQDIARNDGRPLLDIALANGFPDGTSFSHAIRRAFGRSPSALREEIAAVGTLPPLGREARLQIK